MNGADHSNGHAVPPVDLTTLAASAPIPNDPRHPLLQYQMAENLPPVNPLQFAILQIQVRNLISDYQRMRNELNSLLRGK